MMGQQKSPKKLSRFIAYALGRRPDEFGLLPDPDGYVKIKDFLKVLHEENEFNYVRKFDLNEICMSISDPSFDISGTRIRAVNREYLPQRTWVSRVPKLLYVCVRPKAYPVVLERGISSGDGSRIVLSTIREMAERIGRRLHHRPVTLTVQAQKTLEGGALFYQYGEALYETEFIPADCFVGPPISREKTELKKQPDSQASRRDALPGSYLIDLSEERKHKSSNRDKRKQDDTEAVKGRKKDRKQRREPPPWRS